ncbi:Phophatidylserine decarboxylase-domain-containing protein [Aspergillus transmontanensis]|uniref:Phophatidylserine decarboxylase-domain-containing protein n=1 Tax=Aspergillus transmontanensis TaxID=1034304 RepID=A0A5N6WEB8_9EURO|nr:Phophatidylserine decarboxylase-domain-containing protein [Aspergillus transmontanensis]
MATSAVHVPLRDSFHSKDFKAIDRYRLNIIRKAAACPPGKLDPLIQEFRQLIESNETLKNLADNMLQEVPPTPTYDFDPSGQFARINNIDDMLKCLNAVLYRAPHWNDDAHKAGLIGVPFNAILNWPMATPSGYDFFRYDNVNRCLEKILNAHGEFLKSPQSRDALPSWFEPGPLSILTEKASPYWPDGKKKNFDQIYITDAGDRCRGFQSWDAFFSRKFRDGIRPVEYPDRNHDMADKNKNVIANACESVAYHCASKVPRSAEFSLKEQPYSLQDMLDGNFVEDFVGGTVYQAWLAAECYHRWHSPVSGEIKKAVRIPGTYFSELRAYGFPEVEGHREIPDPSSPNLSQRYITAVATRALIFIEADNPIIGLMCFIAVGMDEIASCTFSVKEGQKVMKGQELGSFHLGGSSHCLVFGPQVSLSWTRDAQGPFSDTEFDQHTIIPVNKWLAYASPASK